MKSKKAQQLIKTEHFLIRAWERGYYTNSIDQLVIGVKTNHKKMFYIINRQTLKKRKIKMTRSSYLVIVIRKNRLITLFELNNLYDFLKANKNTNIEILD